MHHTYFTRVSHAFDTCVTHISRACYTHVAHVPQGCVCWGWWVLYLPEEAPYMCDLASQLEASRLLLILEWIILYKWAAC